MSKTSEGFERTFVQSLPTQAYIDGQWRADPAAVFDVHDPATGDVLAQVSDSSVADGLDALGAAAAAQASWATTPPRERGEILRRAYELLMRRADEFALLITLEMGKPLAESRAEVAYGAEFFRWYSEEACRVRGSYQVAPAGSTRLLTMRQPVGPCLLITPWNFPLAMGTRKISPAIAAGCTMVLKPAQETPLTILALARLLEECGLPPGVLNVIPTSDAQGVMAPLIRDPRARKLSFTGSAVVGRKLVGQSAERLLRVSMELGGNAPFIVFEDADIDAAVEGAMLAKMRNAGEACTSANRFLVHESVGDVFARRLAERMAALTIGRGTEASSEVGPLINARALDTVEGYVQDAVDHGGKVLTGGQRVAGPGWFYTPTVLTDLEPTTRALTEEVFGPVAPIVTFSNEDEAITLANATDYGLVSYLYTTGLNRAIRVSEALECGMVGLNTGLVSNPAAPFGGVKASGFGREGGSEGINEYLEVKYVAVAS